MPLECEFATDGYAVCPKCLNNDNTDNLGEEEPDEEGRSISHWTCDDCDVIFSVYDEHPHYSKRNEHDDHYKFYYVLSDWENKL